MKWFIALYRLGLLLAGTEFRRRYGMEALETATLRVASSAGVRRARAASRELGDLLITAIRERRATWSGRRRVRHGRLHPLAGLAQDLREAIRSLRATPWLTAVAAIVLTLGIGASTAIFSVVDAVVLRGLPFDEGDQIMQIGRLGAGRPRVETAQTFFDWQRQQDVFEELAASASASFPVIEGGAGVPDALSARRVTANLFGVLRVSPALGRAFTAIDELEGQPPAVIISDGLWRRRFGADPGVLGRTLRTDTATWTIVGVMPRGFTYPVGQARPVDVWVPFVATAADRTRGAARNFAWTVIGRTKPGVTVTGAQARMQQITSALAQRDPAWFREADTTAVMPLADAMVRDVRPWMMLLLGAVGMLLLITCVNVANLMLARTAARRREIAVRAALGGTRWRLARALLVESVVLAAACAGCGVVVAWWGVGMLKASIPQGVPRLASIALDGRVLSAAIAASTLTGLLCGLLPAVQGSRPGLMTSLKESGRSASQAATPRWRAGLVIGQVALASVLLVGAGLFLISFMRFVRVDLGFDVRNILTLEAYLNTRDASWRSRGRTFVADVVDRLQQIPGVETAAAVVDGLPLTGSWNREPMSIPGREAAGDAEGVVRRAVTPSYFSALRIPLLQGRDFDSRDGVGAERVAILNDVAARSYFPGESAMGKSVRIGDEDRIVVGIVGGLRTNGPESDVWPDAYVPVAQVDVAGADFVVRTHVNPEAIRMDAAAAIRAVRPEQVIREIQTMEGFLEVYAARPKFMMQLLTLFGAIGIAVTCAGIYGVMSFVVTQRTGEIGIRLALGALPSRVVARLVGGAFALVLTGLLIGLGAAWTLAHYASAFLFHVQSRDFVIYAAAAAVLVAVGVTAAAVPARRAAHVDPAAVLRS